MHKFFSFSGALHLSWRHTSRQLSMKQCVQVYRRNSCRSQ